MPESSLAQLALTDTQAQRRMLSSALQRLPWGTNIMEVLQQLDHNHRHGEIISNVLSYEQKFLLNGGASKESMEMQFLLGMKFEVHSSGYRFFSTAPPDWNDLQAWKVCNLVCNYKLAEVLSIVNESVDFSSTLQPAAGVGSLNLTKDAREIIKKISHWPNVLKEFRTILVSLSSRANDGSTSSLPASLQLLQALSQANSVKKGAKIQHNFLIAAAHIAFIKEHRFDMRQGVTQNSDYSVPDFPDMTSKDFLRDVHSKLTGEASAYIVKLCSSETSSNALRFVLHLALLISPLCLCLPIGLHKKAFSRKSLMELASVLGPNKPDILRRVEKLLWTVIFDIVERPQDVATLLKKVDDSLPWNDISALSNEAGRITAWFDIETRCEDPLPRLTSTPVEPVPQNDQGATSLLAFSRSEEPTGDRSVKDGASSQTPVTEGLKAQEIPTASAAHISARVAIPQAGVGVGPDVEMAPDAQPSKESHRSHHLTEDKEDQVDWGDDDDDSNTISSKGPPRMHASEAEGKDGGNAGSDQEVEESMDKPSTNPGGEGSKAKEDEVTNNSKKDKHMDDVESESEEERSDVEQNERMDEDEDEADNRGSLLTQSMTHSRRSLRERKPGPVLKPETSSNKGLSSNRGQKKRKTDEQNSLSQKLKQGEKMVKTSLHLHQQSITLENDKHCEVILGQEITAYDINGHEHKFHPRLNLRTDASLVQTFAEEVKRIYVNADDGRCVPLHVRRLTNPKDNQSILRGFTKSEFERLEPRDLQQLFRFHHLVISDDNSALSFDEQALKTLEKTMTSLISVQDQSIPTENNSYRNQEKIGTLAQLLAASSQEGGPNINVLDFPMSLCGVTRSAHSSELEAWFETQDRPFCKNITYPTSDIYWGAAGTTGARSWLHIDCEGGATKICVRSGAKWVVLGRPAFYDEDEKSIQPDHHFFSSLHLFTGGFAVDDATSSVWDYEAVYLPAGTTLLMRPNTPHMVYTIQNSICHGFRFYTTNTLSDTFYGIVHSLVMGELITNASHPPARALLLRMLHYFHLVFVLRGQDYTASAHLPNLDDIHGVIEFLTLCHIGILFNVLDRRSYSTRGQPEMASLRMEQYDDNMIPKEDRKRFVYGRGLSLELIRWLASRYILQEDNSDEEDEENSDDEENATTIQDFQLCYLIRQGLCIVSYNEQWLEEQEDRNRDTNGDTNEDDEVVDGTQEEDHQQNEVVISSSALERQLGWAMTTVPWMDVNWDNALKHAAAESAQGTNSDNMDMQCEASKKFKPVRRPVPDPSYQPWTSQEIYDNGLTPGDNLYFLGDELFWPIIENKSKTKAPKRKLEDFVADPPKVKRHHH